MDLLNLFRLILGHKVVALVAVVASGCLLVAAYFSSPPVYRASGSVVLLNPPPPSAPVPSSSPATGAQNPYLLFNDLSVVADILVRVIGRPEVAQDLRLNGVVGTYTVLANLDFKRGPIIEVAAEAGSGDEALRSARLVIDRLGDELRKLQVEEGVDPASAIRTVTVAPPERATTVFSSALRRLVAAGGLCVLGTVAALLLAEAISVRKQGGRGRGSTEPGDAGRHGDTLPVASSAPEPDVARPPLTSSSSESLPLGGESSSINQVR